MAFFTPVFWPLLSGTHASPPLCPLALSRLFGLDADGGRAAYSCLVRCISDNYGCEGVLHLVDRPFERNCFFQHNDERPAFEDGERVLGAMLLKD